MPFEFSTYIILFLRTDHAASLMQNRKGKILFCMVNLNLRDVASSQRTRFYIENKLYAKQNVFER